MTRETAIMWMGDKRGNVIVRVWGVADIGPVHWCQPARCRGVLPTTSVWGWSGDAWRRRPDRRWRSRLSRRRTRPLVPSLQSFLLPREGEETVRELRAAAAPSSSSSSSSSSLRVKSHRVTDPWLFTVRALSGCYFKSSFIHLSFFFLIWFNLIKEDVIVITFFLLKRDEE